MNELVQESIEKMNHLKIDGSFQSAYDQMNRSADRMPDNEFMFEAGRRSELLRYKKDIKQKLLDSINKVLDKL